MALMAAILFQNPDGVSTPLPSSELGPCKMHAVFEFKNETRLLHFSRG